MCPDIRLLKVAVIFVALFALLQIAIWFLSYRDFFQPFLEAMARMSGRCSELVGVPNTVSGNEVFLATRTLRIDLDCTGISLMAIYAALVLAYPLRIKRKLAGLAAGLPAIAVANLLRLTIVAQLSGPLEDAVFLFVHDYLFKVAMIAAVIVFWGVYLASARRHAS